MTCSAPLAKRIGAGSDDSITIGHLNSPMTRTAASKGRVGEEREETKDTARCKRFYLESGCVKHAN